MGAAIGGEHGWNTTVSPFSFDYPPGATPLDPNEVDGLIPDYITTQGELNALERENILEASNWAHDRQHADILNATFAFDLHKRMFSRVWKWVEVESPLREQYISALKKADQDDYAALLRFVRS